MRKLERGAVSVEYILITALIAIALIVGWAYLQTNAELNQKAMTDVFSKAANAAAYDAARAAAITELVPHIKVADNLSFASKRVGSGAMGDGVWFGAGTAGYTNVMPTTQSTGAYGP